MLADWVTVHEAAKMAGVSKNTIYRWIDKGWIKNSEVRQMPNGRMVISAKDFLKPRARRRKRKRQELL